MSTPNEELPERAEVAGSTSIAFVTRSVPMVQANTGIDNFAGGVLIPLGEHSLPVSDGDEVVGIACMHDVLRPTVVSHDDLCVRDVMTPWNRVIALDVHTTIDEASHAFANVGVLQMPVIDSGRFIGMVNREDVEAWRSLHESREASQFADADSTKKDT